jgi:hypothetical protein
LQTGENGLPKTRRRFATAWGELEYLCRRIHYWLYRRKSSSAANRYAGRLERVLKRLPQNDLAILRAEGWALLCELKGEIRQALEHRQKEIKLIKRLHGSVKKSVQSGDYDEAMASSILAGRDEAALEELRAVLRTLREKARLLPKSA